MTLTEEARTIRDHALEEWAAGRHYEAHEILEDLAELFDEDAPEFEAALALTHVAACLHKLTHGVGAAAVPGKLARALGQLRASPHGALGLDLPRLVRELEPLQSSTARPSKLLPVPVIL